MALPLTLKHLCFSMVLISIATTSCKVQAQAQAQAQDAVQIVAKAALCFDNQTIIKGCISSLGSSSSGNSKANGSSNAGFCNGPCYGQAMLVISCVDGILSNFAFYNPGMMQGVTSIFQMACGRNGTDGGGSENMTAVPNHGNEFFIPMHNTLWTPMFLTSILLL